MFPTLNDHQISVSKIGSWVAVGTGVVSFVAPIARSAFLSMGAMGIDVAPFAGLTSVVVVYFLSLLQSRSWKAKFEEERNTAIELRLRNSELRNDKEDLRKDVAKLSDYVHHKDDEIARIGTEYRKLQETYESLIKKHNSVNNNLVEKD